MSGGDTVEDIDIGSSVKRQVVTIGDRAGSAVDSIGGLTETAPTTDTASSGLNGRLQRLAQRISSLIALLPVALGSGGGLKVDGSGTALPVSQFGAPWVVQEPDANALAVSPVASGVGNASVTSATTIFSVDTSGYNGISVQITSAGTTCTVTYEGSNDNATWNTVPFISSVVNSAGSTTSNSLIGGNIPCLYRFMRARVSTYGSGTVTAYYAMRRTYVANVFGVTALSVGGQTDATAGPTALAVNSFGLLWNGTSWDRHRSNADAAASLVTLSAQAAGTVNSADQVNYNGRGVIVGVNLTVATTATVTVHIQGKDVASGTYYDLLVSTGIVTAGFTQMTVYPGGLTTANVATPQPLPRTWRVQVVVVGVSAAVTGTVGASNIL